MDRVDGGGDWTWWMRVGSDIYDSHDTKMACLLSARSAPGGENAKYRQRTDSCHRFTYFMFHFTFSFFSVSSSHCASFQRSIPGAACKNSMYAVIGTNSSIK